MHPDVVEKVFALVDPCATVLVLLDSNHCREHVLKELEAYSPMVSPGSYIVATDGVMKDLSDLPRGQSDWTWNNPNAAAGDFLKRHPEFLQEEPSGPFQETAVHTPITYWPGGWLRRVAPVAAAA